MTRDDVICVCHQGAIPLDDSRLRWLVDACRMITLEPNNSAGIPTLLNSMRKHIARFVERGKLKRLEGDRL